MHQQVRTSTVKQSSQDSGSEGGAFAARTDDGGGGASGDTDAGGGLVDILRILDGAGVSMQMAGGRDLDRGGEFVFTVYHDEGDEDATQKVVDLLRRRGYEDARAVDIEPCNAANKAGGLLGCIERIEAADGPVYEIFVAVGDDPGNVPIHITTRADVASAGDRGDEGYAQGDGGATAV